MSKWKLVQKVRSNNSLTRFCFLTGRTKAVRLVTAIAGLIERFASNENGIGVLLECRFVRTFRRFHQGLDVSLKSAVRGTGWPFSLERPGVRIKFPTSAKTAASV